MHVQKFNKIKSKLIPVSNVCSSYILRVYGCVIWYVTLLFAFLCMRIPLRVQSPLRECPQVGRFRATLLLCTIRTRSQRPGGASSVAAYTQTITNKQTNPLVTPTVSALARSGGPRKMTQSQVSRNLNIETRMDRPKAVVGVIRPGE